MRETHGICRAEVFIFRDHWRKLIKICRKQRIPDRNADRRHRHGKRGFSLCVNLIRRTFLHRLFDDQRVKN